MTNSNRKPGKPGYKGKSGGSDRPYKPAGKSFGNDREGVSRDDKPRFKKPFKKEREGFSKKTSDSKSTDYKKKRSFTKNKEVRGTDKKEKSFKPFGEGRFKRPFKREGDAFEKKPRFTKESKGFGDEDSVEKPFDKTRKSFSRDSRDGGFKKPFRKEGSSGEKSFDRPKRSFDKDSGEKSFDKPKRNFDKDSRDGGFKKPFRKERDSEKKSFDKPKRSFDKDSREGGFKKPFRKDGDPGEKPFRRSKRSFEDQGEAEFKKPEKPSNKEHKKEDGLIRLNKYLSNAGICSRREADDLIRAGTVKVNGEVVTEMGFKVNPDDVISYGGATLRKEKKIYVLLNKPKDYITTTDDPHARRTVMELIADAGNERLYPVGRLDRNTTGLLLFTNDGELADKLTHPKFGVKKVYQVALDKNLRTEDFRQLIEGVELEDGFVKPDDISFINEGKKELGIEIHSGKNRIVRRIFEHLGYEVLKLDRTIFAGLSKKDLQRGKWRFLTQKEISFLKMIG